MKRKRFLIYPLIIIILLLLALVISNNCMFILSRNDLTEMLKYDFAKAEILDIKFQKVEYYGDDYTQMCVILKDDNFLDDDIIAGGMKVLSVPSDDYSPDNLWIEKEYKLNELKAAFPELDIVSEDVKTFGFVLTDDVQITQLGLMESAYEGVSVNWFVTDNAVYLTKKLHCKKAFCLVG